MLKNIQAILFFLLIQNVGFGQSHTVYGVINTLDSIPLIGAEIWIKSTKQSVFTDSLGRFVAFCNDEDKLKIKAEGFYNQDVRITKNIKILAVNLKIKPDKKQKDYTIGYGTVSEQDKTNAVENLVGSDKKYSRYTSVYDLIRDNFSGVQIKNGEIIIRNSSTFQGSSAALIVIDGVIVENDILRTLSPLQIKSINILKDGSTAVYGSRGANGVVLIETKKGE